MPWLQLKLTATSDSAEQISNLLTQAGSSAVTMQDAADEPLFEPPPGTTPLWKLIFVTGLFEADADMDRVITLLQDQLGDAMPEYQLNPLEDKDWIKAWMDNFKPMQFGERLWIIPGGYEAPQPDAININLDPGLAFGTGTHPTTPMCLRWLDQFPPAGKSVIDYGCGSGILAIAAALLGAQKVWATDIDRQALIATNDNAAKNQVTDKLETLFPGEMPDIKADVLIANILAGPLVELEPVFAGLIKPGGQFALAGLIDRQMDDIIRAYQQDFEISLYQQQEEWICMHGTRKA